MANPQVEKGYTRIANELLDALCRTHINGAARQVLDVIFRKTYGFHKTEDDISLSQFCDATCLDRKEVCRALKILISRKIVIKNPTPYTNKYGIQKDFTKWGVVAILPPRTRIATPSGKIATQSSGISAIRVVAILPHTKERVKEKRKAEIKKQTREEEKAMRQQLEETRTALISKGIIRDRKPTR